ncbi:MAG: serpin family protein [Elainella sp. Prado103]|jgi:serpin B|nr:serpin family protein [Elainella sp. Prado103]
MINPFKSNLKDSHSELPAAHLAHSPYQYWLALLLGCLALGALSCSGMPPQPPVQASPIAQSPSPVSAPAPMTDTESQLTAAYTQFGFQLLSTLIEQDGNQNRMISPSSVAIALSMLYNGATGSTQQAMAEVLNITEMDLDTLNQTNAALIDRLETADPSLQLAIANSLWGRQDVTFDPSFLQRNQEFYGAEVTSLDFASPTAVSQINGWVSQNTAGKIPEIIDRIDPQQILFLINAVYFKGNWSTQFQPEQTREQPFYLLDGTTRSHPLMTQSGRFRYFENEQFQAVSLPYGNGRITMDVFLPRPTSNLTELQANLTAANWQTWLQNLRPQEGSLSLPKFKLEYDRTLNDLLQAMGMGIAFDPNQASFTALSSLPTHVNEVKHKTYIEVNEEGTEAAAVTSIGVRTTAISLDQPFQMTIDRPFFYAIRDTHTGMLLFMGTVIDPATE